MAIHGYDEEDSTIGKAYDYQLVARLWTYMRPYGWQVGLAIVLLLATTGMVVAQPFIVQQAIDRDIAKGTTDGLWWIVSIYLLVLLLTFVFTLHAVRADGPGCAEGDERDQDEALPASAADVDRLL